MKKITIPKQEVLHYLRYNSPSIDPSISVQIDDIISEVEFLNYKVKYSFHTISIQESKVLLDNTITFDSKDLASFLTDCEKVVALGVSISIDFERKLLQYQKTNTLNALIYDACGSAFVEAICDEFSRQFEEETTLYTTSRFSPGYGDLLLENQKKFYTLLELQKMGVELTESNLMIPRKTVTAFIGLSSKKQIKQTIICDCEECVVPCRKLHGG